MAPPPQAASVLPAPSRRRARGTVTAPSRRRTQTRGRPGLAARSARVVIRLPDSGAVRGVSRTRLWVAVLAVLLTGLVGVNLVAVSFGTEASANLTKIQELERQNAILRSQGVDAIAVPQVREGAEAIGMALPDPTTVHYVEHSPADVAAAAQRLAAEGG